MPCRRRSSWQGRRRRVCKPLPFALRTGFFGGMELIGTRPTLAGRKRLGMTRANDDDEASRERIESALAALARARRHLELAGGRLARLVDSQPPALFEGALWELIEASEAIGRAQQHFGEEWRAFQKRHGYRFED